ncbi:hypothetical protein SBDP1_360012 [Syntrophobacter sp. SbD1]|nr:hypothetical protein SBDP1_360012 [Syntrophobacter sp. SbD1]
MATVEASYAQARDIYLPALWAFDSCRAHRLYSPPLTLGPWINASTARKEDAEWTRFFEVNVMSGVRPRTGTVRGPNDVVPCQADRLGTARGL